MQTANMPLRVALWIALVDLAAGIGILLAALKRFLPKLTVWAALGCSVLQVFAIVFHTSRGEAALTALNYVLPVLSLFVLAGRSKEAMVLPR